ncbi:MAG: acetyl-CoA carboxylase biotin carboxyl carrier protein [Deltaproteobacteria bacterium]|nr:acetyl-CoA carboxylase biotin carboxyl carrier protein [Deltaproteobacteria bacterium]
MELREIKALLALMQEYGLTELELDDKKRGRLKLVRASTASTAISDPMPIVTPSTGRKAARQVTAQAAKDGDTSASSLIGENQRLVTSPMVGTFYRAPSPDAPPYVEEGSSVRKGQTLCIIEAMKMMNEIEAEVAGRIVKILCENTQAVEYGQPLMVVEVG